MIASISMHFIKCTAEVKGLFKLRDLRWRAVRAKRVCDICWRWMKAINMILIAPLTYEVRNMAGGGLERVGSRRQYKAKRG